MWIDQNIEKKIGESHPFEVCFKQLATQCELNEKLPRQHWEEYIRVTIEKSHIKIPSHQMPPMEMDTQQYILSANRAAIAMDKKIC